MIHLDHHCSYAAPLFSADSYHSASLQILICMITKTIFILCALTSRSFIGITSLTIQPLRCICTGIPGSWHPRPFPQQNPCLSISGEIFICSQKQRFILNLKKIWKAMPIPTAPSDDLYLHNRASGNYSSPLKWLDKSSCLIHIVFDRGD